MKREPQLSSNLKSRKIALVLYITRCSLNNLEGQSSLSLLKFPRIHNPLRIFPSEALPKTI